MVNFDSEFFGRVFPGFQATQKIHAQNSRPELSAFLSKFTFLNPKFIHGDFLLTGETKISRVRYRERPLFLKCPVFIKKRLEREGTLVPVETNACFALFSVATIRANGVNVFA